MTDANGVASFDLIVGAGMNVVEVTGIGIGTDESVFAPTIHLTGAAEVPLGVGMLTFTAESITLVGDAAIVDDDVIRLTPNTTFRAGAVWLEDKKTVDGGFEATFSFRISDLGSTGADGIAFVIQDDPDGLSTIGGNGGGIGYDGIMRSLAVEFDTWLNTEGAVDDPDGNHVSVHTRGNAANSFDEQYSLGSSSLGVNLSDGLVHTVVIEYDDIAGTLDVSVDGMLELTVSVDLTDINEDNILDEDGKAWVGFTAATGAAVEKHDVFDIKIEIP